MRDKFKDTKGLDKAYMSLAKHYEERKENAIRQVKDGAFVDLLNQEMEELQNSMKDKEKQIEEMAKDIEQIFNTNCLLNQDGKCIDCEYTDKNTDEYDCHSYLLAEKLSEKYQPKLPEDSIVLSREEYKQLLDNNIRVDLEYLQNQLTQASKETAEKILNELYCTPKEQVENKIKELARFIGVEIKE